MASTNKLLMTTLKNRSTIAIQQQFVSILELIISYLVDL